ncbi:MAG: winged helix-turn-helix domain-containing protein [Ardenticatenaceae bacterium]
MELEQHRELQVLDILEREPEISQADLAARAGVAVGTVNWYLKRWSKKGYVKIKRIDRWHWSYLLTPTGMARKTRLASEYIEASMGLYRRTRSEAKRLLGEVRSAGYSQVIIDGEGEIAEICQLTCLEAGLTVVDAERGVADVPVVRVEGRKLTLRLPDLEATPHKELV